MTPSKASIKGLLNTIEQPSLVFNASEKAYSYMLSPEIISNIRVHIKYLDDVIGNKHYCDNCQSMSYLNRKGQNEPWSCQNCGFIVGINLNS